MTMIAVGKTSGKLIPGSGVGQHRGRIAGGAEVPHAFGNGVFGRRAYLNVHKPNLRGGLIDKQQQKDPASTGDLNHPFDGPDYRSTASLPLVQAKTTTNNTNFSNPFKQAVNKVGPYERSTFFAKRAQAPIIKTQFGANRTGVLSDTSFHPNPTGKMEVKVGQPVTDSTKVVARSLPPSFKSHNNLWQDPNNSYIRGRSTPVNTSIGVGRWGTTKRSVV